MKSPSFELKSKDLAGRIGKLTIGSRTIETPALMPVYNPNKPVVPIRELEKRFSPGVLMTNAYIMLKDNRLEEKVLKKGVHKLLGFDGLVATDSGSYQLMVYGTVSVSNRDIIEFENKIGSDIGSFLDIPTLPDAYKPIVAEQLKTTLQRADEAYSTADFVVNAGVQGGCFLDLREKAARELGERFGLLAVGGIVPLMESYRFPELVDIIATVKKNIPSNKVVHAFGLGHPMVFSLAVALGCDLFDSAAYALYAQDGRYMTVEGTEHLDSLEYLPCNCPVCSKHGVGLKDLHAEKKIKELALHNLYVSYAELNKVKQAIVDGKLGELVALRCRAHPKLLEGFERMLEHRNWLATLDPITKKSGFYCTGAESEYSTEVVNALERIKRVSSDKSVDLKPFGMVPAALLDIYPFNSIATAEDRMSFNVSDLEKIRAIMEYQFGCGAGMLIPDGVKIKKSRKTRRIRWLYDKKTLMAAVRASDHFIIPKQPLLESLHKKFKIPVLRVVVEDDAVSFIEEGKSVFAKFVAEIDANLRPGDEALIVDKKDKLVGAGTLVLSPKEALDFNRGVAVRVR